MAFQKVPKGHGRFRNTHRLRRLHAPVGATGVGSTQSSRVLRPALRLRVEHAARFRPQQSRCAARRDRRAAYLGRATYGYTRTCTASSPAVASTARTLGGCRPRSDSSSRSARSPRASAPRCSIDYARSARPVALSLTARARNSPTTPPSAASATDSLERAGSSVWGGKVYFSSVGRHGHGGAGAIRSRVASAIMSPIPASAAHTRGTAQLAPKAHSNRVR